MTSIIFIQTLEKYYNEQYDNLTRQILSKYLDDCSAEYLKVCLEVLLKRCSRMYGKAPGIAEIEKYEKEILEAMPKPVYLPEQERATPEEAAQFIAQIRSMIKSAKPMAKTLLQVANSIEKA